MELMAEVLCFFLVVVSWTYSLGKTRTEFLLLGNAYVSYQQGSNATERMPEYIHSISVPQQDTRAYIIRLSGAKAFMIET